MTLTHKMPEVGYHAPALALCHVQGFAFGPEDIKTPISANKFTSNAKLKRVLVDIPFDRNAKVL